MTMKKVFVLVSLFSAALVNAQVLFNNGGTMAVTAGGILHVNGDAEMNGATATFLNNGTTTTANSTNPGDFAINNASVVSGDGVYMVQGDWINNSIFNSGNSLVNLSGGNQNITGSVITSFNDLEISGTGIKTQTIDAITTNTLQLNGLELATDVNTMLVTNPATNAILHDNTYGAEGFVSSVATGRLARVTNSTSTYMFPTGSSLLTRRYREVNLTPTEADTNVYVVNLVNHSANVDNLDLSSYNGKMCPCTPNNDWYHNIGRTTGETPATISIAYDVKAGEKYYSKAQWASPTTAMWNDIAKAEHRKGTDYNTMVTPGWKNFATEPYVLINTEGIFVPNVFSPNGDGMNDLFLISSDGIIEFDLVIYNRWGQVIFSTSAPEIAWDGRTSAGEPASEGTYYYTLVAKSDGADYSQQGTVTLIE